MLVIKTTLQDIKHMIVIDSAKNGRRTRSYLCRPPHFRKNCWAWTFQREEATEFTSRKEAQQIQGGTEQLLR